MTVALNTSIKIIVNDPFLQCTEKGSIEYCAGIREEGGRNDAGGARGSKPGYEREQRAGGKE